ncbi:MAG: hypothetical protein QXR48_03400 [Candidatus Woesearchaeota archaeon]
MKAYWGLYLAFFILLASTSFGAVIHGSVYDLDLNTVQAVVEINTTPRQTMVSRNGTYEFLVPSGKYVVEARLPKQNTAASEEIEVVQEGSYVIDLILFPDLSEEEALLSETLDVAEYEEPEYVPYWAYVLLVLAVLVGIAAVLLRRMKKATGEKKEEIKEEKKAEKADLAEILAFIKKEGGRTTQKELRKAIPYSEGKISLMLAELESQGKVKKIKKGRGNIIILQ